MARKYLTGDEWKAYRVVVKKQLAGQQTSSREKKVQEKGDAEVKKSYGNIPI